HRRASTEIGGYLLMDAALGGGQRKRQVPQKTLNERSAKCQGRRAELIGLLPQSPQAQAMAEQLFEGQSLLSGMSAFQQRVQNVASGAIARRMMQETHSL